MINYPYTNLANFGLALPYFLEVVELQEGMEVLTYFGWEKIEVIEVFPIQIQMSNIVTKSRYFCANGIYLRTD